MQINDNDQFLNRLETQLGYSPDQYLLGATSMRSLHPGSRSASRIIRRQESLHVVLFVHIQVSPAPSVSTILCIDAHLGILIFSFSPPFFVCFQLSNGFSHFSLSSESHAGPVGTGPSPHCLPASRLLPRVTSVHLPDYAHYYTIGPGMFPSSQIPSWKVCVSLPFPVPPPAPLLPLHFFPPSYPSLLCADSLP